MNLVIKLAYSAAVAVLLTLVVSLGIRATYEEPDYPGWPALQSENVERQWEEDCQDYHRNVFLIAGLIGLGSIASGVALSRRLDAMRLGLIVGGVATFIYSFAQAGEDIDDIAATGIVPVAAVGLAVLLLLGYRRLAERDESASEGS
ncbi:MAG: hypothetical protein JSU97_05900 [Dehalococcoidia bacterium]|nr:MAG: hypothetical protein JSU97_05900 [Dehalococcoidia bacterium]